MPLPSPNKGESQDKFISRCMGNESAKKEFPDNKQRTAVCFSKWRDKREEAQRESSDWHLIEYSVPILEKASFNDDFVIRGTAISETITHNGHQYIAEELEKATPTLIGKKLLKNHDNNTDSVVGRVLQAHWDPKSKAIKFEAKVVDKRMRELIDEGILDTVSVGAYAEDLVKNEDTGAYIAKGIKFAELSLVAVPADEAATFAVAFSKNFALKEALWQSQTEITEKLHCPECDKEFESKEEMEKHKKTHESFSQNIERRLKTEMTELKSDSNQLLNEMEQLKTELSKMKEEKKTSLIEKYKQLCKEKGVKEKEVSKLSEDMIVLLTDQVSEIKVTEKPLKSEVISAKANVEEANKYIYEDSEFVNSGFWLMPDQKLRKVVIR